MTAPLSRDALDALNQWDGRSRDVHVWQPGMLAAEPCDRHRDRHRAKWPIPLAWLEGTR